MKQPGKALGCCKMSRAAGEKGQKTLGKPDTGNQQSQEKGKAEVPDPEHVLDGEKGKCELQDCNSLPELCWIQKLQALFSWFISSPVSRCIICSIYCIYSPKPFTGR